MPASFQATRLAPSPTGALHLGHARTFLVTWWLARQAGARIFMRMEDLDAGRATAEAVRQAYDDLRWLGMTWDAYPGEAAGGEVVQSRRGHLYAAALQALWERDAIYPCICTRADIAAAVARSASAPHEGEASPRYPGSCAGGLARRAECATVQAAERAVRKRTGRAVCWRLRVPGEAIAFDDLIAGRQAINVAEDAGDFPLTRFDGTPAYQLACVVDDHHMGIDRVVRGDDLLPSTPRQVALYRALGWEPPQFAHVPLVIGADGKRLAKRHGESRIAQFRAAGVPAERIVGWAAWRSGQMDSLREIGAADLVGGFDLAKLPRERVVLGERDMAWLAGG
ncbi:MAG TPA: tRNA glutamyl-Q(34) synthetase GluQRS [Phycisphaerae bacterium]|nr:tRNA glutamyl-Q(34) synthetase GluQRS [Phycisphaerae bacterium]